MEDVSSELKNCILRFEYPLADSMDDDQIADIFNHSNKCFLVSWLISLLNKTCDYTFEHPENTEESLASLIHSLGFCQKKESIPFMRGELSMITELEIIQKMFKALKHTAQSQPVQKLLITEKEIETLKTMDLNLFPMYGNIKVANSLETRQSKNIPVSLNSNKIESIILLKKMNQKIKKLQVEFPNVIKKIRHVEKYKKRINTEDFNVQPKLVEVLKECDKNLKIVTQYLLDLKVIKEFDKVDQLDPLLMAPSNKQWGDIIKNIYDQFAEVSRFVNPKE